MSFQVFLRVVRAVSSSIAVASSSSSAALFLPSIFSEVIGSGVPVLELLALSTCDFGASATLRIIRCDCDDEELATLPV